MITDSPKPEKALLCMGHGLGDTNAITEKNADGGTYQIPKRCPLTGEPLQYKTITLAEIIALMAEPQSVAKERARWIIPSTYTGWDARSHAAQRANGRWPALALDFDKHTPLAQMEAMLADVFGACRVLLYSTARATFDWQRWRIIVPLAEAVPYADWHAIMGNLAASINAAGVICDASAENAGQVQFLPNRGAFYHQAVINPDGPAFEFDKTPQAQPEPENPPELRTERPAGSGNGGQTYAGTSVIDAFNAKHSVAAWMPLAGFVKQGKGWHHPDQTSKSCSDVERDDAGEFLISNSETVAGLLGGKLRRPFNLFCRFEHGDDITAAIAAARVELGMGPASSSADSDGSEFGGFDSDESGGQTPASKAKAGTLERKRKPMAGTKANFQRMLDHIGANVRYNVMKKSPEINIPNIVTLPDNSLNVLETELVSKCIEFNMPYANVHRYVEAIADSNPYNPAAEWILSRDWDGVDRFAELLATIKTSAPDDFKRLILSKWMTGAVAAVFEPEGVSMHGVLVFQGKQGSGKTSWLNALVGGQRDFMASGVMLAPADKDSKYEAMRVWINELGELDATFGKSDIAQLKAFIPNQTDVLRRPYAANEITLPRRTVFAGSVNDVEFLRDATGNRRFWVLGDAELNWQHGIDMQQVWAQVHTQFYSADAGWHMNAEQTEALNAVNEEFTADKAMDDVWFDRIADWLDRRGNDKKRIHERDGIPMADVFEGLGPDARDDMKEQKRVAKLLRALGYERKLKRTGLDNKASARWFLKKE